MKGKNICLILLVVVLTLSVASAITGSLGNSRVVLRLEPGETVEKYVLIKNVNDIPVKINVSVGGDLEKNVKLTEKGFDLQPGEEKKVYYTIKAQNIENITETKLAIGFGSEQGNVGLISTIVVITTKSGNADSGGIFDIFNSDEENVTNSDVTGNVANDSGSKLNISPMFFLIGSSALLFVMLVVLIVVMSKRNKSKKTVKRVE
jgi:hypothetical protein